MVGPFLKTKSDMKEKVLKRALEIRDERTKEDKMELLMKSCYVNIILRR